MLFSHITKVRRGSMNLDTVSTLEDLKGHLKTMISDSSALNGMSEDEYDDFFEAVRKKFGADGLNILDDHILSMRLAAV